MAIFDPIGSAAEVMAAFVSNNAVTRGELPALFEGLHSTLKRLGEGGELAPAVMESPAPAVSIRKSVTSDYLICLEDGKRFKSLRRHLATPEQYRAKWNLPSTYRMVAPNYAAQRSAMAKATGLGQLRGGPVIAPPASAATIEVTAPALASRGVNDVVVAPDANVETVAPEPPTVAKSKAKPRRKGSPAPPEVAVKRKPGRPRKATA